MIDLIIPAYNAEDTIGRALGSVVAQTKPRKFLVTVVDDCSTDATAAIVQKFKGLIPLQYIKLEKNLGKPGLVRQEGIKRTSCPYIMFLDADDLLEPTAGELMSRVVTQHKIDFVVGNFLKENVATKEEEAYEIYGKNAMTWLHGNVYSRKFLEDNEIEFDDKFNEDGSFNFKCISLSNDVKYIDRPISYWMYNRKSITRSDNKFLLKISEDYIQTYSDAIQFVLNKKPSLAERLDFQAKVGCKLGEFLEFYDANLFYDVSMSTIKELLTKIQNFVTILKTNNLITKEMVSVCNERFNTYRFFTDIVRHLNIIGMYELIGIDYKGVMI